MIKTIENWKSRGPLKYFGVPGLGSHFGGPGFHLNILESRVLGSTLGSRVPSPTYTLWGPESRFSGSHLQTSHVPGPTFPVCRFEGLYCFFIMSDVEKRRAILVGCCLDKFYGCYASLQTFNFLIIKKQQQKKQNNSKDHLIKHLKIFQTEVQKFLESLDSTWTDQFMLG